MAAPEVRLRPLERTDLERVRSWLQQPSVRDWLLVAKAPSGQEQEDWYAAYVKDASRLVFAIEHDGQHVGNVGLAGINRQHRRAELNIFIGISGLRGQGLGLEALHQLFHLAFGQQHLAKLSATVREDNLPALRLYEKACMAREGLLRSHCEQDGKRLDMVVYSIWAPESA